MNTLEVSLVVSGTVNLSTNAMDYEQEQVRML